MRTLTLQEAMEPVPPALSEQLPVRKALDKLTEEDWLALPVVDDDGTYQGVLTSHRVEAAMQGDDMDRPVKELATPAPVLRADEILETRSTCCCGTAHRGCLCLWSAGRAAAWSAG